MAGETGLRVRLFYGILRLSFPIMTPQAAPDSSGSVNKGRRYQSLVARVTGGCSRCIVCAFQLFIRKGRGAHRFFVSLGCIKRMAACALVAIHGMKTGFLNGHLSFLAVNLIQWNEG
ncbi:MAG: hypothetical protein AMK71_09950 [Nitrospira bacterium SG8_35_4]|nr:MAG: hypothetical protein AMK71_09950 [Nitrospira bacterium SG8_35_4]